jgi:hypothetical protein
VETLYALDEASAELLEGTLYALDVASAALPEGILYAPNEYALAYSLTAAAYGFALDVAHGSLRILIWGWDVLLASG